MDKKMEQEIIRLREDGWTIRAIRARFKTSNATIQNILRGTGATREKPDNRERDKQIYALYRQGMMHQEIADKMNLTKAAVSNVIGRENSRNRTVPRNRPKKARSKPENEYLVLCGTKYEDLALDFGGWNDSRL